MVFNETLQDRWTIVFNDPFQRSLNVRFPQSLYRIVSWSFAPTQCFVRWKTGFNDAIWLSLNDRVQRFPFVIIERSFPTTPFWRPLNDRVQRSLHTIVERSLSTIPSDDRWTNIYNNLSFGSYNDHLQRSLITTVEPLFLTNPLCVCWTLVFNDPFCQSLNDRVHRYLFVIIERSVPTTPFRRPFNDLRSLYIVLGRLFLTIPLYDRRPKVYNDPSLGSLNDDGLEWCYLRIV